ncbi:hypothetical protein [Nonomuraea sp. NPDC005650]|uniref:hypothetical protein n=1 Tax=Nonomuraea sp. NPDC005650 TaxID=3157045 RepID=UPI0033A24588
MDPKEGFIRKIFIDKGGGYAIGDVVIGALGFDERETTDLQNFILEALGPADPLVELYSSDLVSHSNGGRGYVLKLSARSERTWRIILFHLPEGRTEAMGRALDTLVPTLRNHAWPREAITRGEDLFWWDDGDCEWRSCLIPREPY